MQSLHEVGRRISFEREQGVFGNSLVLPTSVGPLESFEQHVDTIAAQTGRTNGGTARSFGAIAQPKLRCRRVTARQQFLMYAQHGLDKRSHPRNRSHMAN